MRVDVITLFPELFAAFGATGFVGRAQEGGQLALSIVNLRDFGLGKHKSVDDTPYGGGSGMVMRVDVIAACLDAIDPARVAADPKDANPDEPAERTAEEAELAAHRILLTPQGVPYTQRKAEELATKPRLALVCGRYEGFDERARSLVHEEISLGDFVMTGGEVCAMAIIESTIRLLPGVLGNSESLREESHAEDFLLEYPQYTRPAQFRGASVPEILREGHHEKIAAFRQSEREARTRSRRPDLHARYLAGPGAPNPAQNRTEKKAK